MNSWGSFSSLLLLLLGGCRNTDSCCGLQVGERYQIEFVTEVAVDVPDVHSCSDLGLQRLGSVGDTLQVEVLRLKYEEQVDCSEVLGVRLVGATGDAFQFLVGQELTGGFFFGIGDRYHRILGGDIDAPASDMGRWRLGLLSNWCDGVDGRFSADKPELIFGVYRNMPNNDCAEAWGVRFTRVDEEQ